MYLWLGIRNVSIYITSPIFLSRDCILFSTLLLLLLLLASSLCNCYCFRCRCDSGCDGMVAWKADRWKWTVSWTAGSGAVSAAPAPAAGAAPGPAAGVSAVWQGGSGVPGRTAPALPPAAATGATVSVWPRLGQTGHQCRCMAVKQTGRSETGGFWQQTADSRQWGYRQQTADSESARKFSSKEHSKSEHEELVIPTFKSYAKAVT